jgi:hypothetical protein
VRFKVIEPEAPVTASGILLAVPPASQARSAAHARVLIFSASLLLKGLAGVLFFGSVDLVNSVMNSLKLLTGEQVHLPYLPTINAFLWFGGVLSANLPLPLPLSLKLVPILFDSLLAVLVYDLVGRREPGLALRTGLLYAFSPLALLITSFQGQWDAIALYFLILAFGVLADGKHDSRTQALFGALFGLGLLIKPIGLPFLLLFPSRKRRGKWALEWPAILGLTAALGAGFVVFASYGYSIIDALIGILAYSNKGVQTFGLPFAPLLPHWQMRLWIVVPMAVLAVLHHKRKLTAMDAALLFYLCCVSATGLSPQYLLWPLPFLLVTRRLRLAALYTAVATAFLLLYYTNPWTSFYAFENLGVFAPLRSFSWLLPPAVLEKRDLLPIVQVLGNVVLPVCAMLVAALVMKSGMERSAEKRESRSFLGAAGWYSAPLFLVFASILAAKLTIHTGQLYSRLAAIWNALPDDYGLSVRSLDPTVVITRNSSAGFASLNVVVFLALLAAGWCLFCTAGVKYRNRSDDSTHNFPRRTLS